MTEQTFQTTIVTPPVTGYFMHAIEPAPNLQNELIFSAQVLLDNKDNAKTIKECATAIHQAELLGVDRGMFPKTALKAMLKPMRSGDAEIADPSKKRGKEYEGKTFFNANSRKAPGVIRKNGTDIIDDDEIYSGALYRFQVNFYPSNKGGNRICAGLSNVMKIDEGQRMDGREAPGKAFAEHIENGPDSDNGPPDLDGGEAAFE